MKLSIERGALLRSLTHVQNVVERRNTIPILANVLIRAEGDAVMLTATDMDMDIVERIPARIITPGETTASAHLLHDIVRKVPDGSEIEMDGGGDKEKLILRAGRSTFTLRALPVADFPALPQSALPHGFALPASVLSALIDRTKFAISTEETRYYLNGIYLHAATRDGRAVLRAVATDGHRLALFETPIPEGAEGIPGVILPRKTVTELPKLLDEHGGDVSVELSDTRVRCQLDNLTLSSKLIDGSFPDYERVIPANNDKIMIVRRKDFTDAVDRVATISSEKSRAVKLAVADNVLTLSATSPDAASAIDEQEVEYSSSPIEIGFNARYLMDITSQIEGDAEFSMADSASPTVVRDKGDDKVLYVLMPMRV